MISRLVAAAALSACLTIGPAMAEGLDCGKPPDKHLAADDALAKAITAPGTAAGPGGALRDAVKRLKAEGASNGTIVDHAVAAYCPLVAKDDSLTLPRKQEAVRRFASELTGYVYNPERADDTLVLSLPLQPALAAQVDAAAAKAGQTRDEWLSRAVEKAVAGR